MPGANQKGFFMIATSWCLLGLVSIGIVLLSAPTGVSAAPYKLKRSDVDRIREMGINPTLGRGYSIMTNKFQSTCLHHVQSSVPSYNYEHTLFDFTSSKNLESNLAALSNTFAYPDIRKKVDELTKSLKEEEGVKINSSSFSDSKKYTVISTLRVDHYYSSLMEEASPLSKSAASILQDQDYAGFFTICGSNYVRSIRRAQELTSVFTFESPHFDLAQSFAQELKSSGFDATLNDQVTMKNKYSPIANSLTVNILAYGLRMQGYDGRSGRGSLMANSIEEYNEVVKFAFHSMTNSEEGNDVSSFGFVYGIEVVPWVDNVAFQIAARIHEEEIKVPLPRHMIARANHISDPTITTFNNLNRQFFTCEDSSYTVDMHGYCCEPDALYDATLQKYNQDDAANRICKPLRKLDKSIVKKNMGTNAEFITRLDVAVTNKMNQLSKLEYCVKRVKNIPEEKNFNFLRQRGTALYDRNTYKSFTVIQLKIALDPLNDFSFYQHMTKELGEYMDMFYEQCINAMSGGRENDYDPIHFLANPWHAHDECMHLSCLTDNQRWDRDAGGCIPSLIHGASAPGYADGASEQCSFAVGATEDEGVCKHIQSDLGDFHRRASSCWSNAKIEKKIDYIFDQFCAPTVTEDVLEDDAILELKQSIGSQCSNVHVANEIPFGADIIVHFTNHNPFNTNWIGIYDPAITQNYSDDDLLWANMCGHQNDDSCEAPQYSGAIRFSSADPNQTSYHNFPLNPGHRQVCLMTDGYAEPIVCEDFQILDIPDIVMQKSTLTVSSPIYFEGDPIEASFYIPIAYPQTWIGIFNAADISDNMDELPEELDWIFSACNDKEGDQNESLSCRERKTRGSIKMNTDIGPGSYYLCISFFDNAPYNKFICTDGPFEVLPEPSEMPSMNPSMQPSISHVPSELLSLRPSERPSGMSSENPSERPTEMPSERPTEMPSERPSENPSENPSEKPTEMPSENPSVKPTEMPSEMPTEMPSEKPSKSNAPTTDHVLTKQLSAAISYACAINNINAVLCWGANTNRQVGSGGTASYYTTPQPVALGTGRTGKSVSCGLENCCAILDDDSVKCWGKGGEGQLGHGSSPTYSTPVTVSGLGQPSVYPIAIASGIRTNCALLSDDTLKCWGYDNHGQLGDDTALVNKNTPVLVTGLGDGLYPVAVFADFNGWVEFAKMSDRSLRCWGWNGAGQCGTGTTETPVLTPLLVELGTDRYAMSVCLGAYFACAILDDNTVKCWGRNDYGGLGIGNADTAYLTTPVAVDLGTGNSAQRIFAGTDHACVILRGNAGVKCWGRNDYGQLGDGTTTQRNSPVTASSITVTSSVYPVDLDLGTDFTCVMYNGGSVQCFGLNDNGQLGNGSTTNSVNPVDVVDFLNPVVDINFSTSTSPTSTPYSLVDGAQVVDNAPLNVDSALRIDSDGPAALIDIDISPGVMTDCTLMVGLYLESIANNRGWVLSQDNGSYDRGIVMHDDRFNSAISAAIGFNWQSWDNPELPPVGRWLFVTAVIRQGGSSYVFMNGKKSDRTATGNNNAGRSQLWVGRIPSGSAHWTDCWIKKVKVFDWALSDDEVIIHSNDFLTGLNGVSIKYFNNLPSWDRLTERLNTYTPYATDRTYGEIAYPSTGGNFATSGRSEYVAALFEGYIFIDSSVSKICTYSDDGTRLYLDDTLVINNNDTGPMQRICYAVSPGEYKFDLEYWEKSGGAGLFLEFQLAIDSSIINVPSTAWR